MPPRQVGIGLMPIATSTASRASSRVESSVGSGDTSGVISNGSSVQLSATASHPPCLECADDAHAPIARGDADDAAAELIEDHAVDELAVRRGRRHQLQFVARERRGIRRPFHGPARAEERDARAAVGARVRRDDPGDVQSR